MFQHFSRHCKTEPGRAARQGLIMFLTAHQAIDRSHFSKFPETIPDPLPVALNDRIQRYSLSDNNKMNSHNPRSSTGHTSYVQENLHFHLTFDCPYRDNVAMALTGDSSCNIVIPSGWPVNRSGQRRRLCRKREPQADR